MTVRSSTAERFTDEWLDVPELADVWVVSTQQEIAAFTRVTAIISQQSFGAFPQAPNSHRNVGLTLEIVSPLADRDAAADELESIVPAVLDYLDPRYLHGDAEAFLYGNLLAYRIPITVIASKEN